MRLQILQAGTPVHAVDLDGRSLTIGRAPDNDLILRDPDVSGHHAVLFWEGGQLFARDLGSTNGLFYDNERVTSTRITLNGCLTVGGLELRLVAGAQVDTGWVFREVGSPVALPVVPGFSLPGHPGVVLFAENRGLLLDLGVDRRSIEPGEAFALGDRRYVLEPSVAIAPTVPQDGVFPYVLDVDLTALRAVLRSTSDPSERAEFRAAARVSLLYVLGGSVGRWVDNDELGRAVWGRDWERQGANNLNVLVHRIRKQAEVGGFDRRFVERQASCMRLALREAHVA